MCLLCLHRFKRYFNTIVSQRIDHRWLQKRYTFTKGFWSLRKKITDTKEVNEIPIRCANELLFIKHTSFSWDPH